MSVPTVGAIFWGIQDRDAFLAARLAEAICAKRPFHRTKELAEAIRLHLNQELQQLEKLLSAAFQLLELGGRAIIICFKASEAIEGKGWDSDDSLLKLVAGLHCKTLAAAE
eukprot:g26877.t1